MKINLEKTNQSQIFFDKNIFRPFYSNLRNISHIKASRLLAPAVGVSDYLISLTETISKFFESTIKGYINILGSVLSQNLSLKRGVFQIGNGLFTTTLSPFKTFIRAFNISFKFIYDPQSCTSNEVKRIDKLLFTKPAPLIDLESINQSQIFFDKNIYKPFYSTLKKISHISASRILAPAVGLSEGLLNLIETISTLFESIIKGSINILGSAVSRDLSFKGGLILINGGLYITAASLIIIPIRIVKATLNFFNDPQTCVSHELQEN